jgi:hypothetical protein
VDEMVNLCIQNFQWLKERREDERKLIWLIFSLSLSLSLFGTELSMVERNPTDFSPQTKGYKDTHPTSHSSCVF